MRRTVIGGGYLVRWVLFRAFGWAVYLHHFVGPDPAPDPHDHPRRFYSFGLWGMYGEEEYAEGPKPGAFYDTRKRPSIHLKSWKVYKAPFYRVIEPTTIHRIVGAGGRGCWTLCIGTPHTRHVWGFWSPTVYWPHYTYPHNKDDVRGERLGD